MENPKEISYPKIRKESSTTLSKDENPSKKVKFPNKIAPVVEKEEVEREPSPVNSSAVLIPIAGPGIGPVPVPKAENSEKSETEEEEERRKEKDTVANADDGKVEETAAEESGEANSQAQTAYGGGAATGGEETKSDLYAS